MRIAATLLSIVSLASMAGCVPDEGNALATAFDPTAYQDDAHCKSLLLKPGELVYAECRLAMDQVYLKNYNARKRTIEAETGVPLSPTFDQALRADAFCNYDESMKVAPSAFDEAVAANLAYANCDTTRAAIEREVSALGRDPSTFTMAEQPVVMRDNIDTIRQTNAVINGPGA